MTVSIPRRPGLCCAVIAHGPSEDRWRRMLSSWFECHDGCARSQAVSHVDPKGPQAISVSREHDSGRDAVPACLRGRESHGARRHLVNGSSVARCDSREESGVLATGLVDSSGEVCGYLRMAYHREKEDRCRCPEATETHRTQEVIGSIPFSSTTPCPEVVAFSP